ncbi:MAG: hypothetical protein WC499_02605 [Patescibacteria group bacterium]
MIRGRKTTRRAKIIIALLKEGKSWYWIFVNKKYPKETCKYYYYKLFKPKKYNAKLARIKALNKVRFDKKK